VARVFHSIEPANYKLYPEAFFVVRNSTGFSLQLLVFPEIPSIKRTLTHLALGVGLDGVRAAAGFAAVFDPASKPSMVIPVAPASKQEHPNRVYPQTKKGVYVTVCRDDVPGYEGRHVGVGGHHIFIPRGTNLKLYCL
jgi:hypothetical protein